MKIWLRPLPFTIIAAYLLARAGRGDVDDKAPSRSAALCAHLAGEGIQCSPDDVTWLDGPSGVIGAIDGAARALVRGRERDKDEQGQPGANLGPADLYRVDARLSPEGQVLDVGAARDLTHTSSGDEGTPLVRDSRAAYVVTVEGRPEAIHVLDLEGHDPRAYDELSRFQRFQVKVADLQATGNAGGVKKTVFALVPAPSRADLSWRNDGMLEVRIGTAPEEHTLVLDPAKGTIVEGASFCRVNPEVVAKPPTFAPWMSDRLRAVSWFGDEKNQALKAVVFTAMEWIKGAKSKVTGDTGAKEAEEDLSALAGTKVTPAAFTDPEVGWPPRPLEPMLKPALAGEGQWISLDKDPFLTPIPGIGAPFVTTFVRSDATAQHTRVYVTLWDPRLVALHMEAGTVEPVSATGEAGPGLIPRTPEVMRRVVAGFNGGFQATHGEYGMQANGVLYLPPKPYGGTVMELRDGTTAFGAWPGPTTKLDTTARNWSDVPDEVLSYRQNMNAIVQHDKYNPWGRAWWGGVPPGWHDAIHTTRSGLCVTKENFVAYFWGNDIGPEPLGRAMLVARCAFGMHLDMNPGLAGFEFYNVQSASSFQPLGRPLQNDWEHEGVVKDMPDFKFRARRMIKSMGHIQFPRYIQRDGRDFFYLTVRSVLPGTPLPGATGDEGAWRVKGLPQHGYPYAIATTSVRLADGKRARVLRIDPRAVRIDPSDAAKDVVVAIAKVPSKRKAGKDAGAPDAARGRDDGRKLWLGAHVFSIEKTAPKGYDVVADVVAPGSPAAAEARVAVGISDEDGMLQWVELLPEEKADAQSADAMLKLLDRIGCSSRGLVAASDLRAYLGGALDLGAEPSAPGAIVHRFVRTPSPGARTYFETTEIVPQSVWNPLMSQRVKWRPTLAPPDKPAPSASASASGAAPPPPAPAPKPPAPRHSGPR